MAVFVSRNESSDRLLASVTCDYEAHGSEGCAMVMGGWMVAGALFGAPILALLGALLGTVLATRYCLGSPKTRDQRISRRQEARKWIQRLWDQS